MPRILPGSDTARAVRGRALRCAAASGRLAAAHLPFAVVLAAAAAIRVVAVLGYPGPLWFGDSIDYLHDGAALHPNAIRPSGYSIFLWLLRPVHDLTFVVAVQHVLGLLTGVMVYALLWRAGRRRFPLADGFGRLSWRRWLPGLLAAALTVPFLLPTFEVSLEHGLFAETCFTFLLMSAFVLVLWRRRTPWWAGLLAGLLLGGAAVTRTLGLPFIALMVLALVLRRAGWRPVVAAVAAFAAPVAGYMFWFQSVHGSFAMTETNGIFLYGRVASFADCSVIKPDARLAVLCPHLTDPRIAPAYQVMWTDTSPFHQFPDGVTNKEANALASEFARRAILAQPGDYAHVVFRDTMRCFAWGRPLYPTPWTQLSYQFPRGENWTDDRMLTAELYAPNGSGESRVVQPWAARMLTYQAHVRMPGTFLGLIFLAGLAVPLTRLRLPGRRRNRTALLHWIRVPMLPWGTGLALLVVPAATADFDHRYVLPAVPFACLALGLALFQAPRPVTAEHITAEAPEPKPDELAEQAGR
ncbi:hypothetical protein BTM25_13540 [Actinomadura rubteroloni]|uniref:Glycosyltransferase RgtA/B/C/D-like domain-containing protein n=1 Tax=Actinomadura rubteroloni TaxID=1926885 RepID=A0A2P4UPG6_9ACTN|nr:hypothetical protein [Actinomadura rubteroloni]POM26946.1 hypothetical protein BTM25_13540 [Actinomadura rubteroloni]